MIVINLKMLNHGFSYTWQQNLLLIYYQIKNKQYGIKINSHMRLHMVLFECLVRAWNMAHQSNTKDHMMQ